MSAGIEKLRAAVMRRENAEKQEQAALAEAFPVGSRVRWKKAGHIQAGEVKHIGAGRLMVNNTKTGRDVWITVHDIFEAHASGRAK